MKSSQVFLILRQLILATLIGVVGACSFKKEPLKPQAEVIVVEKSEALSDEPEFVLSNRTEEAFISLAEEKTVLYLESIRSKKGETLIDLSIKLKKKKILEYLLARGFNPLLYSINSIQELSRSAELKEILSSFQKPRFYKLFTKIGLLLEGEQLDEELRRMNFQAPSCQELVNLILDGYFFEATTSDSYAVIRLEEHLVTPALKSIFKSKTCSSLNASVNSADLGRWIGNELLQQVNSRFQSIELAQFLLSLGSIENLSIDAHYYGKKVKVDPRLLTFLKGNTLVEEGEFRKEWFNLLSKLVSKDLHFYNIRYKTPEELKADGNECDEWQDTYCLGTYDNEEAVKTSATIFGLRYEDGKKEKESEDETP